MVDVCVPSPKGFPALILFSASRPDLLAGGAGGSIFCAGICTFRALTYSILLALRACGEWDTHPERKVVREGLLEEATGFSGAMRLYLALALESLSVRYARYVP